MGCSANRLATEFLYLNTGAYNSAPQYSEPPLQRPHHEPNDLQTRITSANSAFIANRAGTITLTLESAAAVPGRELTIRTIQAQTWCFKMLPTLSLSSEVLLVLRSCSYCGSGRFLKSTGNELSDHGGKLNLSANFTLSRSRLGDCYTQRDLK